MRASRFVVDGVCTYIVDLSLGFWEVYGVGRAAAGGLLRISWLQVVIWGMTTTKC